MKGKKLSEIKKKYKFVTNQTEQINNAKNWMLAKYRNVELKGSVELRKSELWTIITLTSE